MMLVEDFLKRLQTQYPNSFYLIRMYFHAKGLTSRGKLYNVDGIIFEQQPDYSDIMKFLKLNRIAISTVDSDFYCNFLFENLLKYFDDLELRLVSIQN